MRHSMNCDFIITVDVDDAVKETNEQNKCSGDVQSQSSKGDESWK